jgi:hypothetical protein
MDNSICDPGRKVIDKLDNLKFACVPHPPDSPDQNPCDFWRFRILKQKIKDWGFSTVQEMMTAVDSVWDKLTLEDLQSIFFNWIERLKWAIEHKGEYYTN